MDFKNFSQKILPNNPRIKKTLGILFIVIGLFALFTPLTPGSWLALVGLEVIGVRLLAWDKIKTWFKSK